MLEWSLAALRAAGIEDVVVAAPPEARIGDGVLVVAGDEHALGPRVTAVAGGAARSGSVRAALAAAPPGDVVVHDAARPLVTAGHFREALAALADADCAVAAAPVTDTVKEAGPDRLVIATLDRSRLWAIQTPQAFRREALERALAVGDDAARPSHRRRMAGRAHRRHGAGRRVHARQPEGHDAPRPGHRRAPPC